MNILNKKYIEQLAKGEIALDNSVKNLELLRRILKEAFPKSVTAAGGDNYYYKFGSNWSSSLNKAYIKHLPTIKLEDFLIKELPKDNFGIIIKDNGTEVIKYLIELGYNNYYNFHGNISNGAAYCIINSKIEAWHQEKIKKSNIQLFTLEEIKQLENNMKEIKELPSKWCIKQNLSEEVCDWFCKNTNSSPQIRGGYIYLHYDKTLKNISGEVYSNTIKEGYTEITLEQFNKWILKENMENTQNKKILGYIAPYRINNLVNKGILYVKDNTSDFYHVDNMKGQGSQYYLPKEIVETWESCIEQEFKVGDYVIMEKAGGWGYDPDNNGCIAKITEISSRKLSRVENVLSISGKIVNPNKIEYYNNFKNVPLYDNDGKLVFRLATKEEIESFKPKLPQINNYSGKLEGDYIIYGNNCAKFPTGFFRHLYNSNIVSNKYGNRSIKSIELNTGVKITMEQIEQIVKYIDNQ